MGLEECIQRYEETSRLWAEAKRSKDDIAARFAEADYRRAQNVLITELLRFYREREHEADAVVGANAGVT